MLPDSTEDPEGFQNKILEWMDEAAAKRKRRRKSILLVVLGLLGLLVAGLTC